MTTLGWLLLGSAVLLFLLLLWVTRPRPVCPECRSTQVGLVSKEPTGMRGIEYGGGGSGGGGVGTQTFFDVKYRCNNCGESWQTTITETK